ncbi:rubredoxin [Kribbella italica]|uniref:Rubredoxin n=1 Tax=Kribbella italica TaxID=1540520 RepID=A0A7W9MUT1_9ACTN|nr:rubredoxin [Kribbella italica]
MFECPVCFTETLDVKPYETWPPPPGLVLQPPYEKYLGRPSYEVCRRCGFEFGNDDNPGTAPPSTFEEYRAEWEAEGSPWFDWRTAPD